MVTGVTTVGVGLNFSPFASTSVVSALPVLIGLSLVLVLRRYGTRAEAKRSADELSDEKMAFELIDQGFAERSARYLIECGVDPEEATEVVAREFALSELDLHWLRYGPRLRARRAEGQPVVAAGGRPVDRPLSGVAGEPPQPSRTAPRVPAGFR